MRFIDIYHFSPWRVLESTKDLLMYTIFSMESTFGEHGERRRVLESTREYFSSSLFLRIKSLKLECMSNSAFSTINCNDTLSPNLAAIIIGYGGVSRTPFLGGAAVDMLLFK